MPMMYRAILHVVFRMFAIRYLVCVVCICHTMMILSLCSLSIGLVCCLNALNYMYRGVLKTRWHARVQGGFEGYVRDIWRKFGGHLGVFEATRRLPRGKVKNSFTVLLLS